MPHHQERTLIQRCSTRSGEVGAMVSKHHCERRLQLHNFFPRNYKKCSQPHPVRDQKPDAKHQKIEQLRYKKQYSNKQIMVPFLTIFIIAKYPNRKTRRGNCNFFCLFLKGTIREFSEVNGDLQFRLREKNKSQVNEKKSTPVSQTCLFPLLTCVQSEVSLVIN